MAKSPAKTETIYADKKTVRVNAKLFLGLVVFAVALGGAFHLVRAFNVSRNAEHLKGRAQRAYDDGNLKDAIRYMRRYLTLAAASERPAAQLKLANWSDEGAKSPSEYLQAYLLMDRALGANPDDVDLRRRFVRVGVRLRRFQKVLDTIDELCKSDEPNAEFCEQSAEIGAIRGRCLEGLEKYDQAAEAYTAAIRKSANGKEVENVGYYMLLVSLLDRRGDRLTNVKVLAGEFENSGEDAGSSPVGLAKSVLNSMVSTAKPRSQAYLARAAYYQKQGDLKSAVDDVKNAIALDERDLDALLRAVELEVALAADARLRGKGDEYSSHLQAATDFAQRARAVEKNDVRVNLALSRLALDSGRFAEGRALLEEGLATLSEAEPDPKKRDPKEAELEFRLRWSLANIQIAQALMPGGDPSASGKTAEERDAERKTFLGEAEESIEKLAEQRPRSAAVEYLRARILFGQRAWRSAATKFESIRRDLREFPDAARNADLALAECFGQLGSPDDQFVILNRAVQDDPFWAPLRQELAISLLKLGRVDEALSHFAQIMNVPGNAERVVEIHIGRQLKLPAERRRWEFIEGLLNDAERARPDAIPPRVLRAEVLFHQGKFDEAVEVLNALKARHPEDPAPITALLALNTRRPDLDMAQRLERARSVLMEGEKGLGDVVPMRLGRAHLALLEDRDAAAPVVDAMSKGLEKFRENDRVSLLRGLGVAYGQCGLHQRAVDTLRKAAALQPDDLGGQMLVADFLSRKADAREAEFDAEATAGTLAEIRRIEGPGGPNGDFVEARAIIHKIVMLRKERGREDAESTAIQTEAVRTKRRQERNRQDRAELERAHELLSRAERQRRGWPAVPALLGSVEILRDNPTVAFDHFRRALDLGDRSPETINRVLEHLYRTGRNQELIAEVRRIEQESPDLLSGDLARVASVAAYQSKQYKEALGFAKTIQNQSRDYRDLIIKAQMLMLQPDSAAEVSDLLKRATELAPEAQQTWFMRVGFLVQRKRMEDARAVIREAESAVPESPPHLKALTLAVCHEMAGDRKMAETKYEAALLANPDNTGLVGDVVSFHIRGNDLEKADQMLNKLLARGTEIEPSVRRAAVRTQALLKAARSSSYTELMAARSMLSKSGTAAPGETDVSDLRAEAAILTRSRYRRDRMQLMQVLESIGRNSKLEMSEQLQLAQLYDVAGRWADAKGLFVKLREQDPANPVILAEYANAILRQKPLTDVAISEAQEIISVLERREAKSFRLVVVKSLLLDAQGRRSEVVPLVQNFVRELPNFSPEELFRDLVKQQRTGEAIALLAESVRNRGAEAKKIIMAQAQKLLNGGDEAEALGVLKRYLVASDFIDGIQFEVRQVAAMLLESLDQFDAAEQLFRENAALDRKRDAGAELVLASYFARRKRVEEALEICARVADTTSAVRVARVSVGILRTGNGSREQIARVEERLVQAIDASEGKDAVQLSMVLADLRDLQERYEDSIAIYRALLDKDGNNIVALNNLAWLLSFRPVEREVCLAMIDKAIKLRGPMADLLDTRAVIRMNLNKPGEAVQDLRDAYDEVSNASILFHLAQAQLRVGNTDAAAQAFRDAQAAGFDPKTLHPLERSGYEELIKGLGNDRRARL
jgi:cellulose synthase operon protein C